MASNQSADRFLESADLPRLRYRDEGHGPAVLLVHGWLLDLTMWDALAAALLSRYRVIRWDRRGFGQSAGAPDLGMDVADGVRLLDLLGVKHAAVLGMSQGCRIALSIAEGEPGLAACLILDGAPPLEGLPDRQWHNETPVFEYRALLVNQGIDALRAKLATHPLLRLHANDKVVQARMDSMRARYAGTDLMALPPAPAPGSTPGSFPDRFSRLQLPVLVLNGEFDSAQRLRVGETLTECIAGAERRIVADSRHMACWDNPTAYDRCVVDFLNKHVNRWE
jgi:3-oxoadipate enol-lactonase